jgi:putative ABC transport system substrate-binding protein
MAHQGCLIGYGPSRIAPRKRLADQVAQIFRGVAPGDIPIERPAVFEFALNLKIAKSLDLIVPPALLTRADEVIEYFRVWHKASVCEVQGHVRSWG